MQTTYQEEIYAGRLQAVAPCLTGEPTTLNQAVFAALKDQHGSIGILASNLGLTTVYLRAYFAKRKVRPIIIDAALDLLENIVSEQRAYETNAQTRLCNIKGMLASVTA